MPRKGSLLREFPILVVVALLVSLFIKTFLVQFFFIPSGSMENTLQINDRVAVNKLPIISRNIRRGDVVSSVIQQVGFQVRLLSQAARLQSK
jgi:signal peptidase I